MNDVMLSIYVATYNHEKYIEKALDSIFMQVTDYSYEVIVGEDCSRDNTREILKQYEKKHEDYVKSGKLIVLYRDKNMNNSIPDNTLDLKHRCRGKYVVALEGDDFWIDEKKIDKQISFLEEHEEYIAVSHNCTVVGEDNLPNGENYPECKDEEYTLRHYMSNILPGQLTTVLYRNIYIDDDVDTTIIEKCLTPGDKIIYLILLLNGRVRCIQESMSAYRHITDHGSSYSATDKYKFVNDEQWHRSVLEYLDNQHNDCRVGELLYQRCILKGVHKKQCGLKVALKKEKAIKHKWYCFYKWIVYKFRKDVLKSKYWI